MASPRLPGQGEATMSDADRTLDAEIERFIFAHIGQIENRFPMLRDGLRRWYATARAEGFAAGEASMREKAGTLADKFGRSDFYQDADGKGFQIDRSTAEHIALSIRALPPSSPAVWTADTVPVPKS